METKEEDVMEREAELEATMTNSLKIQEILQSLMNL